MLQNQLQRTPTPYPKELKSRIQQIRNLAIKKAGGPIVDVDGNMVSWTEVRLDLNVVAFKFEETWI